MTIKMDFWVISIDEILQYWSSDLDVIFIRHFLVLVDLLYFNSSITVHPIHREHRKQFNRKLATIALKHTYKLNLKSNRFSFSHSISCFHFRWMSLNCVDEQKFYFPIHCFVSNLFSWWLLLMLLFQWTHWILKSRTLSKTEVLRWNTFWGYIFIVFGTNKIRLQFSLMEQHRGIPFTSKVITYCLSDEKGDLLEGLGSIVAKSTVLWWLLMCLCLLIDSVVFIVMFICLQ